MTTPTPHERLRAVLLAELNERQWDGIAYAAHGRHKPHRNAGCRVCQADVDAVADLMASTALRAIERQVHEQVAAEIERVLADYQPVSVGVRNGLRRAAEIARGEVR